MRSRFRRGEMVYRKKKGKDQRRKQKKRVVKTL